LPYCHHRRRNRQDWQAAVKKQKKPHVKIGFVRGLSAFLTSIKKLMG
jgi:hypothetical protein